MYTKVAFHDCLVCREPNRLNAPKMSTVCERQSPASTHPKEFLVCNIDATFQSSTKSSF